MANYKRQTSDKIGLAPGTMVYIGDNPPQPTQVTIHIYDSQSYHKHEGFDFKMVHDALIAQKHVWIDIAGLADVEHISELCQTLHIHPLIAEDIVNTHQRPKLEFFEQYIFLVFKLINPPQYHIPYKQEQFTLLAKKNLLLTFRESNQYDLTSIYQRLTTELSVIRQRGSDYLTYLIMDNIVDCYFNFVETCSDSLANMENILIEGRKHLSLKDIYIIKRHSLTLKKAIGPLCDIIDTLLTDPSHLIDDTYRLYYRDLRDHTLRLLETINLNFEMTSSMLDIYLSTMNNNMNRTMKILTQFASMFIPLSFITGIYGMNFEYMPELKWHYGYPLVLGFMGVVALLVLYYFKRNKIL